VRKSVVAPFICFPFLSRVRSQRRRGAPRRRTSAVEATCGTIERHPGDALCPESEAWTPPAARSNARRLGFNFPRTGGLYFPTRR
jgi:hypothetical protein